VRDPELKTILGIAWCHGRVSRPSFKGVDFTEVDLSQADLFGIQFVECKLRCLIEARMNGVVLLDCDLDHADLSGAVLAGAFVHGTTLRYAKLSRARLHGAEFSWCALHGADLSTAETTAADFWRCEPDGGVGPLVEGVLVDVPGVTVLPPSPHGTGP